MTLPEPAPLTSAEFVRQIRMMTPRARKRFAALLVERIGEGSKPDAAACAAHLADLIAAYEPLDSITDPNRYPRLSFGQVLYASPCGSPGAMCAGY